MNIAWLKLKKSLTHKLVLHIDDITHTVGIFPPMSYMQARKGDCPMIFSQAVTYHQVIHMSQAYIIHGCTSIYHAYIFMCLYFPFDWI